MSVVPTPWCRVLCVALAVGIGAAATCPAATPAWSATLLDGSHVDGLPLEHWFAAAGAGDGRLRSFRWLRSQPQRPAAAADGPRIEFAGGDCLPGKVTAAIARGETVPQIESHLLVSPSVDCNLPDSLRPHLRILPGSITKIVRRAQAGRLPRPSTAWLADGRTLTFHAWRWQGSGIRLLTDSGVHQVPLEELDEIHFPQAGSLETYFASLAVLLPQVQGRLLLCRAAGGLRATVSSDRLRLHHPARGPDQTWFIVQPAWSLDALCLGESQASEWLALEPVELPLSWIAPVRSVHRAALSAPWQRWRLNANVQGGPLISGGQSHAWGFGVHGYHELEFALPAAVAAFRTGMGLDAGAGTGGSAEARLEYSSGPSAQPFITLYRSPTLVGSQAAPAQATVKLPGNLEGARLRLVADSLVGRSPAGADPLDIRDLVDWLEPVIEFEPARLRLEVTRRLFDSLPGAGGWALDGPAGSAWQVINAWDPAERPLPAFRPAIAALDGPLTFTRTLECNPGPRQLLLGVVRSASRSSPVQVRITIDGQSIGSVSVPTRDERLGWRPLIVPIPDHGTSEVEVELRFVPTDSRSAFEWHGATITAGGK
jgi:hypothetical protein